MPRRIALAAALFLILVDVIGAEAPGLYEEAITVSARDDKSRSDDFRRALVQVLGRVIATEAMASKGVSGLLTRAGDFVEQFEYLSAPASPGESGSRTLLRVQFDRERLTRSLQAARIGVWGEERPELVVWLVIQDGAERRFVTADEATEFHSALEAAAGIRRLSIVHPLMDLTDQTNLTVTDVESGSEQRIREATRRYESDTALVGTLQRTGDNGWESRWRFVGFGRNAGWRTESLELRQALQSGVDGAYNQLVSLYAPTGKAETVIEVQIVGVASMSEAERSGEYLRTLPIVKQADWVRADSNRVVWRLRLAGGSDTFRQILGLSRVLRPALVEEGGGGAFVYQWVP